MGNAIVQSGTSANELAQLMNLGQVLARSGMFADARQEAQAVVKVLAGHELGFPAIASMTGIHVINGRVTLSANLMAAAVKRSQRYDYRVTRLDNEACEIDFYERTEKGWEKIGASGFTIQDARKAQTRNLDKFPRNMLFARALSNGTRWYCPDIFGGPVYTPDEMGAEVDEEGQVTAIPAVTVETPEEPVCQCAICEEQVNERAAHAVAKLNGGEVLCKKHWEASDTYRAQQAAKKQKQKGEGVETPLEARFPGGGTLEEPAGELPAEDDDEAAMVEAERAEAVIEADIETGALCAGCFVAPVEADGDLCTSCAQRDALAKEAKAKRGGRRAA